MQISREVIDGILITVGGAAALGVLAGAWSLAKRLLAIPVLMEKIMAFQRLTLEVQMVHGDSLVTSLTCQRDGHCNGNVEEAIKAVKGMNAKTNKMLRDTAIDSRIRK